METTTILGESRDVGTLYPDGSYNCPWCFAAVRPTDAGCPNPGCDTSRYQTREGLQAKRDAAAQAEKERAERAAMARWRETYAIERAAERRAWQEEQIAEATRRGACLHCLFTRDDKATFIRHRNLCPRQRNA